MAFLGVGWSRLAIQDTSILCDVCIHIKEHVVASRHQFNDFSL